MVRFQYQIRCLAAFLRLSAALLESEVLGFDLATMIAGPRVKHIITSHQTSLGLKTELCEKCSTRCVEMMLILILGVSLLFDNIYSCLKLSSDFSVGKMFVSFSCFSKVSKK